jgi:hypothetical protein
VFATEVYYHPTHTNSSETLALNFNNQPLQLLNSTADLTLDVTNYGVGKAATLRLYSSGVSHGLSFNSSIVFVGEKPSAIPKNKYALLSFTCYGNAKGSVIASYALQD